MKFNPFCMCCAINKQEKKIRDFDDADRKTEYMKKVMELMANAGEDDCAPSISIDLKKMFSDFWEQPMEDYSSIKKEFNQLMLDLDMKGIPLAYNKDMQEDKELTFDAIDTVKGCIALFTGMVSTMEFRKDVMEASAKNGFTNATDAADYLVNHGVPFRDAHGIVGRLVLTCIDKGISLDELPLEEYKEISPVFEQDIYEAISMKTCVEKRETYGAPGPKVMEQIIALNREYLKNN